MFSEAPFSSRGHAFAARGAIFLALLYVGIFDVHLRNLGVRFSLFLVSFMEVIFGPL